MRKDVIIVGGSLAGLNTARYAAKRRASVLLFERKKEIGSDVRCGEAVVEDVLWDADIPIHEGSGIIRMQIERVKFNLYRGRSYTLKLRKKHGYVLNRGHLEEVMAENLVKSGVEIRTGVNVRDIDLDGSFPSVEGEETLDLVGADGLHSRVGKAAEMLDPLPPEDIAKVYQETVYVNGTELPWRHGQIEVYWNYKDEVGYGWLFPLGGGEAHIGMGVAGKIAGSYLKIMQKELREELLDGHDYEVLRSGGKAMPLARPLQQVVKRMNWASYVCLVGDAARTCLAHLGSGMGGALVSGRICGESMKYAAPPQYQEWYMKNWYPRGMRAWEMKEKFWNDPKKIFRWAPLILFAHSLFPGLTEKYAFRSARYVSLT